MFLGVLGLQTVHLCPQASDRLEIEIVPVLILHLITDLLIMQDVVSMIQSTRYTYALKTSNAGRVLGNRAHFASTQNSQPLAKRLEGPFDQIRTWLENNRA
jgi:hypothetical protein